MAAEANNQKETIYHVASSFRWQCKNKILPEAAYRYFTAKPWINKDGKPILVKKLEILSSMYSFHRYMAIHYLFPLKELELANMIFCKLLDNKFRESQREINFVLQLVDIYKPYISFSMEYLEIQQLKSAKNGFEKGNRIVRFRYKDYQLGRLCSEYSYSWTG